MCGRCGGEEVWCVGVGGVVWVCEVSDNNNDRIHACAVHTMSKIHPAHTHRCDRANANVGLAQARPNYTHTRHGMHTEVWRRT